MSLTAINDQVLDLDSYVESKLIKVIPLKRKSKLPKDNDYYNRDYSLEKLNHYKGNFGIVIGYNHDINGQSLAIVDIDGVGGKYKKETADYIYDCLKDIPGAMLVQTQSGGKHIYLWNRTICEKIHETSKHLHFPSDFPIDDLRGKSLQHAIEIYTKPNTRQCLLPGCVVKDTSTGELNDYHIISQINRFEDISVVDDINETVKNKLLNSGFTWADNVSSLSDNVIFDTSDENNLKELSKNEIIEVSNIVSQLLNNMDGAKHEACMDLGGYLSERVTQKSAGKICDHIMEQVNFDSNNAFKHTVLHNYEAEGHKKGLPSFLDLVQEYHPNLSRDSLDGIKFRLEMNCRNHFRHTILFKTYDDFKKQYLVINYDKNTIDTYTWNMKKDETTFYTNRFTILNMSPVDIYEFFNILDTNASAKICLKFYSQGMPAPQIVKGDDIEAIEKQLKKRPGLVLKPRDYHGIINEIIREYIRLGLIHTVEEVPVPGLFINPRTGELVRSGVNGAIDIIKPSIGEVKKGLKIWNQLQEVYPGSKNKLATIIRWGLLSPFSYILKDLYEWQPCLYLYGASRTSKTTLAEISLMPYTSIDDTISIGGGAFDTEYRIGNALSRQGIGVIINEPATSIEDSNRLEIIKRGIEDKYCREKQEDGLPTKIPSYSNMCFTSNHFYPSKDAFVRRSFIIEFTSSERLSEDDIARFNEVFHYVNKTNNDFQFLRGIGDYIVWYVYENLDMLSHQHDEIVDSFLNALIEYSGEDVRDYGWLFEETELMDISSTDDNARSLFRSLVLQKYSSLARNSKQLYDDATTGDLPSPGQEKIIDENDIVKSETADNNRFKRLFMEIVKSNHYDYLLYHRLRTGEEFIYVTGSVREALGKYADAQISCKSLADFLGYEYSKYTVAGTSVRSFRVPLDEFVKFLRIG